MHELAKRDWKGSISLHGSPAVCIISVFDFGSRPDLVYYVCNKPPLLASPVAGDASNETDASKKGGASNGIDANVNEGCW